MAYSAQVSQYFDRLLTPPVGTRAALYVALVDDLVSAGVWSKLDALWMFAAADIGSSLINLKSGSFQAMVIDVTGPPIFTIDRGWNGCAGPASRSVNLNLKPATAGGNYSQNDALLCGWYTGNDTEQKPMITGADQNGNVEIWPYGATTYVSVNTGGAEMAVTTPTPRDGFWLAQRTSASAQNVYHNDTFLTGNATASSALVNVTLVCAQTINRTNAVAVGGSLSTGSQTALYNALQTYLHAVGAA